MDFRQIRSFLAVADEGSMTAAARRLHLTQPAISRQIKSLEDELGVELLERGAHSISLTPAGEILARDGAHWIAMSEKIVARVREVASGGVIRVAYAPSLAGSLLGLALERFAQLHPKVRIQLFDRTTAEMKQGLEDRRFELIVAVPDERQGSRISWRQILQRRWRLAMPPDSDGEDPLPVDSLKGRRLVIYQREEYPDYWRFISAYFQQHGVAPVVVGEFDGWSSLRTAVEGGLGAALVAEQNLDGGRVVFRRIDPEPDPICVSVGWLTESEPSAACQVLIDELRQAAEELGHDLP